MNDLFLNGVVVKIEPSTAVLTEFMRNGWTQNDVLHALSSNLWKDEDGLEESPLEVYKGGLGYFFDWGHVIESNSEPCDDVPCFVVNWNFCLDDVLTMAHRAGKNLDDLCDLCLEFFEEIDCSSWPVFFADGASMSCFSLIIQASAESDIAAQEVVAARVWIVEEFFEDIFPSLLLFLEDELSGFEALH